MKILKFVKLLEKTKWISIFNFYPNLPTVNTIRVRAYITQEILETINSIIISYGHPKRTKSITWNNEKMYTTRIFIPTY